VVLALAPWVMQQAFLFAQGTKASSGLDNVPSILESHSTANRNLRKCDLQASYYQLTCTLIRINQLPYSDARWQHGSHCCFTTFIL